LYRENFKLGILEEKIKICLLFALSDLNPTITDVLMA
jgi:hypothetical protein